MDNIPLLVGTFALAYAAHSIYRARYPTRPGPPGIPLLGNALQFGKFAHLPLTQWAKEYGDIYFLRMGVVNWAVLSSSDAIDEVIAKNGPASSSRPSQYVSSEIINNASRGILLAPYNEAWKRNRQIFSKALTKSMVTSYAPIVEYVATTFARNLLTYTEESKGKGIYALDYCQHYTLGALLGAIFGECRETLNDPLYQDILKVNNDIFRLASPNSFIVDFLPFLRPFYPTTEAIRVRDTRIRLLDTLVRQYRDRIADPAVEVPPCMARALIEAHDDGIYDELELHTLLGNTLSAGTDTTGASINWMTILLAKHPEVQSKMQEEIDRVVGRNRLPTEADLKDLVYIQCVVRESARMRPPFYLTVIHVATEDLVYNDNVIPKGTWIIPNIYPIHFDPVKYENPFSFNPDRWETDGRTLCEDAMGPQRHRDNWMFGAGRRICVGMHLAEQEFLIAAAFIAWSFTITPGENAVIDVDAAEPGFTMHATKAPLCFIPRGPEVRILLGAGSQVVADSV